MKLTQHFTQLVHEKLTKNIGFGVLEKDSAVIIEMLKKKPVIYRWWWAAASIVIIIVAVYFGTQKGFKQSYPEIAATDSIIPGRDLATLTLADGNKILLDSAANGRLAIQNNAAVIKKDGQILYSKGTIGKTVTYNIMSTPRGGQYQLVLPDGSHVWLNAASTIKYPVVFPDDNRTVEISGEAYFEIHKDRSRPFRVITNRQAVEVLGTQFNINCYEDEESIKTTLLEGSVKILRNGVSVSKILKPGQQSLVDNTEKINVREVNTAHAIAWKRGFFQFEQTDLHSIMRTIIALVRCGCEL